jgi:asparagine N-glycosylation enzyme membrane subunit Stt3
MAYSRIVPVAMFFLKGILGGKTPRKIYVAEFKMQSFAWATVWPPICLIVSITIVYSVIQPIICGLALVAFAL